MINAGRDRVYDAFTNPEKVGHWWGPDGFTITIETMNVEEGGEWRFMMHGPDGTDYPNLIRYSYVDPPNEIRFSHGNGKEGDGKISFTTVITFEDQNGKTLLTMRSLFESEEILKAIVEKANAIEGGKQTINRLEDFLA